MNRRRAQVWAKSKAFRSSRSWHWAVARCELAQSNSSARYMRLLEVRRPQPSWWTYRRHQEGCCCKRFYFQFRIQCPPLVVFRSESTRGSLCECKEKYQRWSNAFRKHVNCLWRMNLESARTPEEFWVRTTEPLKPLDILCALHLL